MLATVLTVLAIVGGANAHLWWNTPTEGAYPSQVQPLKTMCNTRNDTAAATTLMFNAGAQYTYGVTVNAHGGGQFNAWWFPATTTDNVTYTFGAGSMIMVSAGSQNFTNFTTTATVTGMYPAGAATGYGVIQLGAATKDAGNTYYACRWAHATAAPAGTTGTTGTPAVATTGVTTGTTTGTPAVATTGKKSSAGVAAASLAVVAAASMAALA
jgi:hypothetical protein